MKSLFKRLPFRVKIISCGFIIILLFAATIMFYFIPFVKSNTLMKKKELIREHVQIAAKSIDYYYRLAVENKITVTEAKKKTKEHIKNLRYSSINNYFWINDTGKPYPVMIMHPTLPALDGKILDVPRFNCVGEKKKNLFQAFVDVTEKNDIGYVQYLWPKPVGEKLTADMPKLSCVYRFKQWNWIIGTGIYIDDVDKEIAGLYLKIIFITLVITAISSILLYLAGREINQQLGGEPSEVVTIAGSLAEGDFSLDVNVKAGDEKSAMAAMSKMKNQLEKMIQSIIASASTLGSAVEEINQGNQNFSQRTSEQATSLEEMAATIQETVATVNRNAENSEKARELSNLSVVFATEGGEMAGSAALSINRLNETSEKIGDIISVINDIAFQTNLLSLNAAVEAARAGEHGRGFAVVAGEVRNLAERSGNAAKEISTLIEESLLKIQDSSDSASKSGDSLNEIINSIKGVSRMVEEIVSASFEQKQGIEQINIAINEIDKTTQQNAALAEETASASEEMANQAKKLIGMMGRFRISSSPLDQ